MKVAGIAALAAVAVAGSAVGAGPQRAPKQEAFAEAPVVVEMFLSQACKLCPPAADYVAELAHRPGVVALAWHIDYWNMLANREHGHWEDPFARADFSDRQRRYNEAIRNRSTVFTPQAVINGEKSVVGSKRDQVEALIDVERKETVPANIDMTPAGDGYAVTVAGDPADKCEAFLVTFHPSATTEVRGGDNAGMRFEEANVVSGVVRLGEVTTAAKTFAAPRPEEGMGCAVIVQEPGQGRIVAARYCP